jgi:hypothetical protein
MKSTPAGMTRSFRLLQLWNANDSILVKPAFRVTLLLPRPEQLKNALDPMVRKVEGIVMLLRLVQFWNVALFMMVMLVFCRLMLLMLLQFWNALLPMVSVGIVVGRVTLVMPVQPKNA